MKREVLIRLPKLNDCSGSLLKKWFIYYSVRNPKTGKMERFKEYAGLHSFKTKKERYAQANKLILKLSEKLKNGWTPYENNSEVVYADQIEYVHIKAMYGNKRAANKNFRFFASQYIAQLSGLEKATISTYTSKLRIFSQWLQINNYDGVDISAINNQVILKFFRWVIEDQKRSSVTVNKYKQILSSVFDYAITKKNIQANPVFNIPHASINCDFAPRPIQLLDIEPFLEEIDKTDAQLGLVIRFEYNCFIRPKEIQLMQIKWIDFGRGTITIPRHILKTKHDRIAVIPDDFLHFLTQKHKLHTFPKEYFVIGNKYVPAKEGWGSPNTIRRRFNVVREKLNMPTQYKLYSWKHTGNVAAEEQDLPMVDRQNQNGHLTYKTTEIYVRNKTQRGAKSFKKFIGI